MEVRTSKEDIKRIYEEVKIHFSNNLNKTLDDIEVFYENLIASRKKRLLEQKNKIETEIIDKTKRADKLKTKFDECMKYLGDHQALDVFVAMNNIKTTYVSSLDNLQKYQEIQNINKEKLREIDRRKIEQTEATETYLKKIASDLDILRNYFRELAKCFYPNSVAGLSIENNEGDNQLRYKIDAKIESDTSDGINNVKIFCYDMTLLFRGQNHNINFIFHDSRIFDGIDERQKTELFRILYKEFCESNKQYIATINQNQLSEIKNIMTKEQYNKIINENIIYELTDEMDSGKLLGITVDI
jgi:uncharacterized protein YydD (DUF2326 family)